MVTIVIAWAAGIALVVVAANRSRFERVLGAATRSQIDMPESEPPSPSEQVFVRVCRGLTIAVGAICIALGVLGVWSRIR